MILSFMFDPSNARYDCTTTLHLIMLNGSVGDFPNLKHRNLSLPNPCFDLPVDVIKREFTFFLDSTFHALYYYISMFMIGLAHRFMHAQ